jgi:hypothetical protein
MLERIDRLRVILSLATIASCPIAVQASLPASVLGHAAPISQLGGPVTAVVARGRYAYVAVGGRVAVLDTTSQPSLAPVGLVDGIPSPITDMALHNNLLVLAHAEGLTVIDTGDGSQLRQVMTEQTGDEVTALMLVGRFVYAFVGRWHAAYNTHIFELRDDGTLHRVISVSPLGSTGVVMDERYAYLIQGSQLGVFDVTDPRNPARLREVEMPAPATDIIGADKYSYVATNTGLVVLDVSDLAFPYVIGQLDLAVPIKALATSSAFVYLLGDSGVLYAVSPAIPTRPQLLRQSVICSRGMSLIAGGSGLLAGCAQDGLLFVDVSDGNDVTTEPLLQTWHHAEDIVVKDGYAYIAAGYSGLVIVDVTHPDTPHTSSVLALPGIATRVAFDGRYLFVGSRDGRVSRVDVTDRERPRRVDSIQIPGVIQTNLPESLFFPDLGGEGLQDIAVLSKWLYVAAFGGGLVIVDSADVSGLRVVDTVHIENWKFLTVTAFADLVYTLAEAGGGEAAVGVFEVGMNGKLQLVSSVLIPTARIGRPALLLHNSRLYATGSDDPGSIAANDNVSSSFAGSLLPLGRASAPQVPPPPVDPSRLFVIDVTETHAARIVGLMDHLGAWVYGLASDEDGLVMSSTAGSAWRDHELIATDFEVGNKATTAMRVPIAGAAVSVAYSDGVAYVAADSAGLVVVDVKHGNTPSVTATASAASTGTGTPSPQMTVHPTATETPYLVTETPDAWRGNCFLPVLTMGS